jgi:catechol 2,3-dioxygenase-like lactoylglutathione lyase family enzyme
MDLRHLGLPVRDLRRSQQFYSAYFGFDRASAQEYEDGTVIIRDADGFDWPCTRLGRSSHRQRPCMPASKPQSQLTCAR